MNNSQFHTFVKCVSVALLALVVFVGCKTTKSKDDMSWLKKEYENTTARYNGYFNATVIMDETDLAITTAHQDNYNTLLPLYLDLANENPRQYANEMDRAIEKVSTVVNLHPISNWSDDCYLLLGQAQFIKQDFESAEETFDFMTTEFDAEGKQKGKKFKKKNKKSKAAKQREIKQKRKAREKAQKKKRKARKKEIKRKKKEREKLRKARKKGKAAPRKKTEDDKKEDEKEKFAGLPTAPKVDPETRVITNIRLTDDANAGDLVGEKANVLEHRPALQEGQLWMARTYVEREKYLMADRMLAELERNPNIYPDVAREIPTLRAHMLIKQERPNLAIPFLEQAIAMNNDRKKQARYAFVKAQLHERNGDFANAEKSYQEVIAFKPSYTMEFSARLQGLRDSWATKQTTSAEAIKGLERMLKDDKNIDYRDRIYYVMAEIALADGDRDGAMAYLQKAIQSSVSGSQKTEIYYLLATRNFEDARFVDAKAYYDSTLMVMPEEDARQEEVQDRVKILSGIAANLVIVELQDSLIRVSNLPPEAQKELAYEIRKKENEDRLAAIRAAAVEGEGASPDKFGTRSRALVSGNSSSRPGVGPNQSTFFAYNDKDLKRGLRDFNRIWGDRPLQDDWRAKKSSDNLDLTIDEEEEEVAQEEIDNVLTDEDVKKILRGVPSNPQEKAAAESMVEEALYNLGVLYRSKLEAPKRSISVLEELLERFTQSKFRVDAWYLLYVNYKELGDSAKAEYYAEKVLKEAPESEYAKIIKDPNYATTVLNKEGRLNRYYREAYAIFEQGRYKEALQRLQDGKRRFGAENSHIARFDLLQAMCLGNVEGKEAYVEALKNLIKTHSNTPEATRAKEILRLLGESGGTLPGGDVTSSGDQGDNPIADALKAFEQDFDKMHYILVVFKGDPDLNEAKTTVSDYNLKFFKNDRLRISNIYLGDIRSDDKLPVVIVRRFKNKEKAMEYYMSIGQNRKDFMDEALQYEVLPISQGNYRKIIQMKSIDLYRIFFAEMYLN